jgi:hypothetical protein
MEDEESIRSLKKIKLLKAEDSMGRLVLINTVLSSLVSFMLAFMRCLKAFYTNWISLDLNSLAKR